MTRGAAKVVIHRIADGHVHQLHDALAIEEPMEIRLLFNRDGERQRESVAVTMRTPGNDIELALGFLYNEGVLASRNDFRVASHFGPADEDGVQNIVHVELQDHVSVNLASLERNFVTSSSCGVCGKKTIESLTAPACQPWHEQTWQVDAELIHRLPQRLRQAQAVFDSTGGLHAAALFALQGELILLREDVGRHNALDKLIGRQLLNDRLPSRACLLVLSGRASFELIQKASRASIAVVIAIGAPSSLAVKLAQRHQMTLIGFARADRFNIYSGVGRVFAGPMPATTAPRR